MARVSETYTTKEMKLHGEVRKAEWETGTFTTKEGTEREYGAMRVKILDDNDDVIELYDKTSEHINRYARGQVGTFTIRVDIKPTYGQGNYDASMLVIGFEEDAE